MGFVTAMRNPLIIDTRLWMMWIALFKCMILQLVRPMQIMAQKAVTCITLEFA